METTTSQSSLWLSTSSPNGYPSFSGDSTFDVAVVGGGIAGLSTALLLKQSGARVGLIEADRVGSGVTGNNTAKVSALQSTIYSTIQEKHGKAAASDYAAASMAGVAKVAELVASERIDCGLARRTAYTYAFSESEKAAVEREAQAARIAGLPVFDDKAPDLPFPVFGAVGLDEQISLHPLRYAQGLAAAIEGDGCRVFERSRVTDVQSGRPCEVRTESGTIRAGQVVVATHYPILDRGLYFARLEPTRAYAIAARLRSGAPPADMSISAGNPSWSLNGYQDYLVVCGQSHSAGQRNVGHERFQRLVNFAQSYWDTAEVTHLWSAQDPSAYDMLPMVGTYQPSSSRLYVATGFMKWGLSSGTFAGMILRDLITGQSNPWASRFNPHRLSLRSVGKFARMNAEVAADFVGDRLRGPDTESVVSLKPGNATTVKGKHGKYGVYRDDQGRLHKVSLRCTHLGCLVHFNQAEHSWDCPCHGSRFDVDGHVLEGPAVTPLAKPTEDEA